MKVNGDISLSTSALDKLLASDVVIYKKPIDHLADNIADVVAQCENELAISNANVFIRAGSMVQVSVVPPRIQLSAWRPEGALIICPVNTSHLAVILSDIAQHRKYDGRSKEENKMKPCNCPRNVADALVSRGHWPEMNHLSGFIESPTITLDGRLIDCDGYDPQSGLFMVTGDIPGYKRPPQKPTLNDAKKAYEELLLLVKEFPFVGGPNSADAVAAVSAIITALVRRVLPAAPLFAYTAPTAGTGKTLLSNTAPVISTGRESAVLSLGHDDAETEKRLYATYLAGDAVINIDNVEGKLGGVVLCQVCTQPTVKHRPLGGSGVVDVPTNALLMATGNNLSIVGDLKRRVVLIRLDAKIERPEQRTFNLDHLANVKKMRGKAIAAALTIPLAYLAAGAPPIAGSTPYGSFADWDRLVRLPLLWLGLPNPLDASEALREQDPDLESMRLLFAAWLADAVLKHGPVTAAEVVKAGGQLGQSKNEELYDSLQLVCSEKPNTRRLGYWLRAHCDKIVDGMQLKKSGRDEHAKVVKWIIVKI